MDINKVMKYRSILESELNFDEISKLYREIIYNVWCDFQMGEDDDKIHCYQLLRDLSDIFEQMVNGRKFDENYLKDKIKW